MRLTFIKGVALGAVTSMLTLGASAALAGVGVGAPFNLGKVNKVNATSTLTGSAGGSMLKIINANSGAGARAINASSNGTAAAFRARNNGHGPAGEFDVAPGVPPFTVNSATEVGNLNSALLDGLTSGNFYLAGSTVVNSSELGGMTASAFGDRWFAVVNSGGSLAVGNGVSSTQREATGSYDVRFSGNISDTGTCAVFAQLMSGIGWVVARSSADSRSEFEVLVYNTAGDAADAEFSLYAAC